MASEFAWAFLPVFCLLVNAAAQVLCFRLAPPFGMLRSVFLGFAAGGGAAIGLEHAVNPCGSPGVWAADLISYFALGYCYFHFVNLGETARRIRILREIHDSGGGLTMDEILSRYGAREVFELRVRRLVENGQVTFNNGRYFIGKPAVLIMSKALVVMKRALLGRMRESG